MDMDNTEVLIVGGGVPGLALAALLKARGIDVRVADGGDMPDPATTGITDGRTVAIMGDGIALLRQTGIWDAIAPHACPLRKMAVVDDSKFPRDAKTMIEQVFDAAELGREQFGWNLPLSMMRAQLGRNVPVLARHALARLEQGKNTITARFSNGHAVTAKLVVGADGRKSSVREAAGIKTSSREYGQMAMTCVVSHTGSHNDMSTEFHRSGGPFTIVPMPSRHSAIVWVERDADAKTFLAMPKQTFCAALQERTRGRIGAVSLVTNPHGWPLATLTAQKVTAPRIALMAEAAHVMSPIGAQGLNLSLRDVGALARIVGDAVNLGLDMGAPSVLAQYETARTGDIGSRTFAVDLLNRAVATDHKGIAALRRLALGNLDTLAPIRSFLMHEGLSPSIG